MFNRRLTLCVAASLAVVLLGACGNDSTDSSSGASEEPEVKPIQQMSVTINDDGAEVDVDSIEAAPIEVTVQNHSKGPYHLSFAKLNEGVTLEDVEKNVQSEKVLEMITVAGSDSEAVGSGQSGSVTIMFPEGDYIALDPEAEMAFAPFSVAPATSEYEQPEADVDTELGEFYFEIPETIPSGPVTISVTNVGEQSHEWAIGLKKGGDEEGEGFMLAPAPGGTVWGDFDLEPGDYHAVCFFPDPKSGKPHIKLGMETEFTVE